MARQNYEFTSESVSEGHPDKVCDRISDEIVDLFFRVGAKAGIDPYRIRVACETLATTNRVVIAGEVRGPAIGPEAIERHGAPGDPGHRLRTGRLPLARRQDRGPAACAVGRHRPGRRRRRQQGRGRGRPGHHVRLRLPRDAGAHAGAALLRAQDSARDLATPAPPAPKRRSGPTPRARSRCAIGTASRSRRPQIVVSHQHLVESLTSEDVARSRAPVRERRAAGRLDHAQDRLAHQPDRQVLHRRPGWRLRPDRAQDHRRHLWRRGAARRRRLLGQGSDQGRPLGRLCGALSRQERRRRRSRRPLHAPALLRDRRRRAAVDLRRPARHRQGSTRASSKKR